MAASAQPVMHSPDCANIQLLDAKSIGALKARWRAQRNGIVDAAPHIDMAGDEIDEIDISGCQQGVTLDTWEFAASPVGPL